MSTQQADNTGSFDAGSEFGDPAAAVQTALTGGDPADDTEVESTDDEGQLPEAPDTWSQPSPEDELPTPAGAPKPQPTRTPASIEVKGDKGVKKFNLDPQDTELQQTLRMGLGARKWQRERDEARTELGKIKADHGKVAERAKVWDDLETLARGGHYEQLVRVVLGDAGYKQFTDTMVREHDDYQSSDPDARHAIEKARDGRQRAWETDQAKRREDALQSKLQEIEDRSETDRLRTLGTSALSKYDFRNFHEDTDLANSMNTKLWRLAWTEVEDLAEAGKEITPEMVNKVFAANAKVLRAGGRKVAQAAVTQMVEQKTQQATRQAQIAATERYPAATPTQGWSGTRAKDLLKQLVQGK